MAEQTMTDNPTQQQTQARSSSGLSQQTETGTTRISEGVVAKIAGLAARDIPGVFSMGSGLARRMGQLKSMVGGDTSTATQGVSVIIEDDDATIDVDIVTWYGQSIVDISDTVRRNIIGQVEGMTGLHVAQVNIQVNDVQVDTDDGQGHQPDNRGGSERARDGRSERS